MTIPFIEENDQTAARAQHLAELQNLVGNVYPNKFERAVTKDGETIFDNDGATVSAIVNYEPITKFVPPVGAVESPSQEQRDADNAELNKYKVRIAGRIATPPRVMGKAAFVHLSDGVNRLQIYVRKQDLKVVTSFENSESSESEKPTLDSPDSRLLVSPDSWTILNLLDHGDFIGVGGFLFITKTGELSVHVETLQFLAKAMLPMPDKVHGISDPEIQRRYRYADLIADSLKIKTPDEERAEQETGKKELTTREVFQTRARLISGMREFLDRRDFTEVETPMLTPKATGAAAKPFKTHHNALDIELYARIAPELYLKRLLVGGFERVYELNRNFRNEGLSHRHNPEFTMLEFYAAYWNHEKMMDFTEKMIQESVQKATGGLTVKFEQNEIDFGKFERLTMKEAIAKFWFRGEGTPPRDFSQMTRGEFKREWLDDPNQIYYLAAFCESFPYESYFLTNIRTYNVAGRPEGVNFAVEFPQVSEEKTKDYIEKLSKTDEPEDVRTQRSIVKIFETLTEHQLIQPTFITDFPKAVSPLSKASPKSAQIAERFELFINGMECANGFSELNAPVEQYERFLDQANQRERGDDEAMVLDEDYIRALSYGMPPAAGIGIGIDRLVMLLTNRHSIRDVILFPHLRPERKAEEQPEENKESTTN